MSKLTVRAIADEILRFIPVLAPQMGTVNTEDMLDENEELKITYLNVNDTLSMWLQLPDSGYNYMFCGWMVGKGYLLEDFPPSLLHKAVCLALTGSENTALFDGDYDAPQVLN